MAVDKTQHGTAPAEADRSSEADSATVYVIIATRNRPRDLRRALVSLTRQTVTDFVVIVVDQSDDVSDNAATITRLRDSRFRHLPSATRGKSRALNEALQLHSMSATIAFTDDDCEVPPTWLETIRAAFDRHSNAGIIFGSLTAIPHDESEYFVPAIEFLEERVLSKPLLRSYGLLGMGANMAISRATFQKIGLFDVDLGPGGPLFTGEECELMYRALNAGIVVVQDPTIQMVHWGLRPWSDGAADQVLTEGFFATMAGHGKHARHGDWRAVSVALHETVWLIWTVLRSIVRGRRPFHIRRMGVLMRGFSVGFGRGAAWPRLN